MPVAREPWQDGGGGVPCQDAGAAVRTGPWPALHREEPGCCPHLPSSDSVPNAVWIWDIQKLRLFVVLEQLSPVRFFQWDPQQPRLAICTGGGKVYLWSPAGCVSVQVPGEGERCHVILGQP